jgi:phage terminase large subunit-like protein
MFTEDVMAETEIRMGPLAFAGQHQQIPTPAAGNLFKAEMLCQDPKGKTFWPLPSGKIEEAYFSWDTATKAKSYNDFTAGCVAMMASDGYLYLVPVTLGRLEIPDVVKEVALQWARWSHRLGFELRQCFIEDGAGAAVIQYVRALMEQRGQETPPGNNWTQAEWDEVRRARPIPLGPYSPQQDKVARASAVLPYVSSKQVRLVDTSVSRAWLDQLLGFHLATHDDAVDATVAAIKPWASMTAEQIRFVRDLKASMVDDDEEYDPNDPDDL